MKAYDLWLTSFVAILIAVSCYKPDHSDVPDKATIEPVREKHTIVRQLRNIDDLEPTPIPKSACELEVESLRSEVDIWREKYNSCGDSLDDSNNYYQGSYDGLE